ncbi:MAG: helix-turn-helix transcriptional regulator [Campylobacterota bacterium]|nr:helix-turn-helix transcriptional regulator [Campylobacterota bacterium]
MSNIGYLTSDKEIMEILSQRITNERIVQNINQKELSKKANISLYTVREFEQNHKISLENLIGILRALGKTNLFNTLFDFKAQRVEVDAVLFQEKIEKKYNKKRVKHASKQ